MDDDYEVCFKGIVKYPDCNATQNLFGGKLLMWLDEYVAIAASQYIGENRVVTKKFSEMIFEVPIELRKVVTIYAKPVRDGRTSVTMHAYVIKSDADGSEEVHVAEASIVYVAVDENGRPKSWQ